MADRRARGATTMLATMWKTFPPRDTHRHRTLARDRRLVEALSWQDVWVKRGDWIGTLTSSQVLLLWCRIAYVDYFAAAATQAPPAVVPAVQARRGNGRRLGVALVAVVVVLVAIWLTVGAGKPSLASVDRPNGSQRPLLTSIITHDPTGGPSFEIDLPAAPDSASVATQPASDGSVSFGDVRLGGSRFGALLLVRGGQDWANSARKSLEQEAARGESTQVLAPAGHIRRTLVGATPAYAREFVVGNGEHLREFRFSHDGYVYGAGIMYRPGDTVSLDTALAALRTLRWVS